jgi:hypothetical protein
MPLPPVLSVSDIHGRLQEIFPEGTPNRNHCVREIAARTVFVMLYVGAVEGGDIWLRPDQVTRMTDAQTFKADDDARLAWAKESIAPGKGEIPGRWYAANTREPIRDETLCAGLVTNGAVTERQGVPTTSPAGRYALKVDFAGLFAAGLTGSALRAAIQTWRAAHLNAGALARIAVIRKGAVDTGKSILVTFPGKETRHMAPGPSSIISKAVIEEFAPRFLDQPGVIFVSESGQKVVARDDVLAKAINLHIKADRHLPDIVLVDLAPRHPLLVFVEVVATDGPVTPERKAALLRLAEEAGFSQKYVAFVTAYLDRSAPAFRRTVGALAWDSFVWFAAEPQHLILLREGKEKPARRLSNWVTT